MIVGMVVGHPEDCTHGIEGGVVMTSTLLSPCGLVGASPDVGAPYAGSLGWDDGALVVAERPPSDSHEQGHFLMACF